MTTIGPNITNGSAGFTLLELLVVMSIIALVATISFSHITGGSSDEIVLRATANALEGALRATRANAILRNNEATLIIDVDRRTFQSPTVPLHTLPSDIFVQLRVAEPERFMARGAGIRFYPDGTSTGGDLRISLHGREIHICVNWLTGEPRSRTDC